MSHMRSSALGLMAVFLFVLPFTSSVALRNVSLVAAAICAISWMRGAARGWRERLPPARLWVPVACWSLWCILSVVWSIDRPYTLSELRPGLLPTLGAFALFYAMTDDYTVLDRWAFAVAASLAVLAFAAIGQQAIHGEWDAERWHVDRGYFSTHIVLAVPMLAWLWFRFPASMALRSALAATVVATLVVTFWTDNRIVWVCLAVMIASSAGFAMHYGIVRYRRTLAALALLSVVLLGAMFVAAIHQRQEIKRHPELRQDPRIEIWRFSLARAAESPWIGYGYGRGILREPLKSSVEPGGNLLHWHGHNIVLNVALQLGIVGLALFAWMWAAMVRELLRALPRPPPHRWCAALGITLLLGFAAKNMTDDFFVRHVALLTWATMGAILGALRAAPPRA